MDFPARLKHAMALRKIKQTELATLSGLSRETINLYANGKVSAPSASSMEAIARALGLDTDWFVSGTGPSPAAAEDDSFVPSDRLTFAKSFPDITKEWHPTRNGDLKPWDIAPSSNVRIWWQCSNNHDHIWRATANKRALGRGCPFCSGNRVHESNCLATVLPEVAQEWHPTER